MWLLSASSTSVAGDYQPQLGFGLQQGLAQELGIEFLYLPSDSPNLDLIERSWKFVKKNALRGRYYATFAEFRAGIDDCLGQIETTHLPELAALMTHNSQTFDFQTFDKVSLFAG